jgi:hypothetical protein
MLGEERECFNIGLKVTLWVVFSLKVLNPQNPLHLSLIIKGQNFRFFFCPDHANSPIQSLLSGPLVAYSLLLTMLRLKKISVSSSPGSPSHPSERSAAAPVCAHSRGCRSSRPRVAVASLRTALPSACKAEAAAPPVRGLPSHPSARSAANAPPLLPSARMAKAAFSPVHAQGPAPARESVIEGDATGSDREWACRFARGVAGAGTGLLRRVGGGGAATEEPARSSVIQSNKEPTRIKTSAHIGKKSMVSSS